MQFLETAAIHSMIVIRRGFNLLKLRIMTVIIPLFPNYSYEQDDGQIPELVSWVNVSKPFPPLKTSGS